MMTICKVLLLLTAILVTERPTLASTLPDPQSSLTPIYRPGEDTISSWGDEVLPRRITGSAKGEEVLTYLSGALWTGSSDAVIADTALFILTINGLQIYSIGDTSNPTLVSQYHLPYCSRFNHMCLDGDYLYVGAIDYLCIFDVSDPFHPVLLSDTELEGIVHQIRIIGNRAYVGVSTSADETNSQAGFFILDISDRSQPHTIGKYGSSSLYKDCRRFVFAGEYVYATNTWAGRVEIIDISDETRPLEVGAIVMDYPIDIAYLDGYLYIDKWYDTLVVYDLVNPLAPQRQSSFAVGSALAMEIYNGRLFAVCRSSTNTTDSLRVFDIPIPGQLNRIGGAAINATEWALRCVGDNLLIPNGYDGFTIFNIANPGSITTVAQYKYAVCLLRSLATYGDYCYAINYLSYVGLANRNGVHVIDISDKENPRHVNSVLSGGAPNNAVVSGQLLFVNQSFPTYIYSLSDPANPVKISQFPSYSGYTTSGAVRDSTLYVLATSLFTVDISDPSHPLIQDSITMSNFFPMGILLSGNLAYSSGMDGNLTTDVYFVTYDISDPHDLVAVDSLLVNYSSYWERGMMAKRGDYIYLANWSDGIATIDIRTPTQSELAMTTATMGEKCYDVKTSRGYLFAACLTSVQVFSLDDPVHPALVQYVPLSSLPQRIVVDGDYLYVSSNTGIHIYHMNLPPVVCGDASVDGSVDISDVVCLISYIFSGGPAPDPTGGDSNCDALIDISDAVYLIAYIFAGGLEPCAWCK